jgi:hypothetical protein
VLVIFHSKPSNQSIQQPASHPARQPASRAHIAGLVGFVAASGHHLAVAHHHAPHRHLPLLQSLGSLQKREREIKYINPAMQELHMWRRTPLLRLRHLSGAPAAALGA